MRIDEDLTVIIPYSGDYARIKLCLLVGLARQTIKPNHIIIVCDNHTDVPHNELRSLDIPYTSVYFEGEKGHRSALRNVGIKAAETEWLLLLDDDIMLAKHYFEELQKLSVNIEDNKVIHGFIVNRKIDLDLDIKTHAINIDSFSTIQDNYRNDTGGREKWNTFCTGNLCVSKRIMIEAGLFDENMKGWGEEDTEMGYRVYVAGGTFSVYRVLTAFHIFRRETKRRARNKNWAVNLKYALEKHKGTEYAAKRTQCYHFARRYS